MASCLQGYYSDLFSAMQTDSLMPYVKPFDDAIKSAVVNVSSGEERKTKLRALLWDKNARKAHPRFEHLLPVHIASGAAGDDKASQLFTLAENSMSWAQYRFGNI